jgi:hypothetical protein
MITASHVVRQVEEIFFQPQPLEQIKKTLFGLKLDVITAQQSKNSFHFSSPPDDVDTWSDIVRKKYIAAQQPAAKHLFFNLIEDPFTKNYGKRPLEPQTAFFSPNLDEQVSETQMNRSQAISLRQGRSINDLIEFSSSSCGGK